MSEKKKTALRALAVIAMVVLMSILMGCTYEHDGKILIDADGNLYQLNEAITNESYNVTFVPASEVDKLLITEP